jgi:hypothetical protein
MPKTTGSKPAEALRHVYIVYCRCGHANSVQNVKPDDKVRLFCVGCGDSLEYRPNHVRRVSVTVPALSLRDFKFPSSKSGLVLNCVRTVLRQCPRQLAWRPIALFVMASTSAWAGPS